MKWDKDPLCGQKHLVLDAIISFFNNVEGKKPEEISLKDAMDFVDGFCDHYYRNVPDILPGDR